MTGAVRSADPVTLAARSAAAQPCACLVAAYQIHGSPPLVGDGWRGSVAGGPSVGCCMDTSLGINRELPREVTWRWGKPC
jgi:hypothetical protein